MKLQHLIVIFLVIMIPLVLVMSQYTSLQIDTLAKKTKYDTALLGATFDTMAAFELNTRNSKSSSVIGEEIRDLEAIVSTFTNSLSTSLNMTGVSDDYIMSYVPAIVFTLYDGYYIYSINSETGERELKPYVYYTKTYTNGLNTNITISYSLDNYVTIYGTYEGQKISAAGYLVVPGDVEISDDFIYATRAKEDGSVENYVVDPGGKSWVKYKGIKIEPEDIYQNETVVETRGIIKDQSEYTTESMLYYYEAAKFTEVYNKVVQTLNVTDRTILKITETNNPEDEASLFMNEKINVIKDSITQNLNTAIYNYDGAVAENYEMPQLNGEDWDKILNNISIIAFLKNIPIGTTNYNNYVVVNSTTNQKYVSAKSIDFIAYDKDNSTTLGYYHNIICDTLIDNIKDGHKVVGYAASDFERYRYSPNESNEYYYYYKHNEYGDYDCQIKATERINVSTIKEKLSAKGLTIGAEDEVLKTYYTAVGRIRYELIKASSYINKTDANINFKVKYDPNSGSWANGSSEQITVHSQYGKLRVNQEEPTKVGNSFLGWAIKKGATLPDIKTGEVLYLNQTNSVITLYAVYAKQYTIEYHLNGGSGGPVPNKQTKIKDVDFIISKSQPTRENKIFRGWSTSYVDDMTPKESIVVNFPKEAEGKYDVNADLDLYAVWDNEEVRIEYYSDMYITAQQSKLIAEEITLFDEVEAKLPANKGKKFKGWITEKGERYDAGAIYNGKDNLILRAVWDPITYTITFDSNGGKPLEGDYINPASCTKIYGVPYSIPDNPNIEPERDSYKFIGWSTNQNATMWDYQPGGTINTEGNITLYAVWEGETYTIEYDANGGSNAPEKSAPILKSEDATLTVDEPEKTGYEFIGWSTDKFAKQTEVEYKPGDIYTGRTSVKLYAIWKKSVYKVIYIVDGNEFASQTKTYQTYIYLITQRPEKQGYIFRGWSETNGGAINHLPGQKFTKDELAQDGIIRLYAVWTEKDDNIYMVNYLPNGGTFKQEDLEKGINNEIIPQGVTTFTIRSEEPTREGYIFKGWSRYANATQEDSIFEPDQEYSIDIIKEYGDKSEIQEGSSIYSYTLSLYAVWEPKEIKLTINPDGTTWRNSTESREWIKKVNESITIELPQEDGYTCYWEVTEGDAKIVNYSIEEQTIQLGKNNSTIKAVKVGKFYNLTYDANGGEGAPTSENREYKSKKSLSETKPTRTGYIFKGWSNTSGGAVEHQAGSNFTMPNHDVTLYAVWEIKRYQLTYNANGGQGAPTSENREYNSKLALSNTKPTRTGYTFKGWSNTKTGNVQYQPEASFTMPNQDVTLYAVWEIKTYQLIYNKNATDTVSNLPDTEDREFDSSKALSTKTPTRTGYIFKGWSTENNVGSAEYQPGENYGPMPAYNVTLYAVWEPVVIERTGQFYMRNAESTSFIICIGWQQKYNKSTNSSTFTITKIQLKSTYGYKEYYPNGTIHINDDCVITMDNQGKNTNGNATHKFNTETTSAYYDITPMLDGQPSPPFAVDINHDTDGNNVEIELKNISFYNIFAAQSWLGPRGKVTIGQGGEVTIGQGGKEIIGENGEKIIEY